MSERTFRRWRELYLAEGAAQPAPWAGLARRAPVDEVMRVLELFETRYPDSRPSTSTRSWSASMASG